jgi:hypothetical protein
MSQEKLRDLEKIITEKEIAGSKVLLSRKRKIAEIRVFIDKVLAEGQGEERLVIFLRRHWVNLFLQIWPLLAFLVLIIISYFFLINFGGLGEGEIILSFGTSVVSLFLWAFLFFIFIDYYLDVWVITNERIVNIEQRGLFKREISELRLEKVQDLTTEIGGIISTLFDFGDLYVQTAGKRERFLFKSIPHPERIKDVILVLSGEEES